MKMRHGNFRGAAMFVLAMAIMLVISGCGAKSKDSGTEQGSTPENTSNVENPDSNIQEEGNGNVSDGAVTNDNKNNADDNSETGNAKDGVLPEEKIKELVLNDAGIAEKDAFFIKVRLEKDDGILVYDVEFYVGDKEYEYTVEPVSGKILEKDIDN